MINDLEYLPPLGASDHSSLTFGFQCYTDKTKSSEPRLVYHRGDYDSLRAFLDSMDWSAVDTADIQTSWNLFSEKILEGVDKCIPRQSATGKSKKKPWVNKAAMDAIGKKRRDWKKYQMCKNDSNYQKYAASRNKATREVRSAKRYFEKQLALNINTDNKSFWNYVRSQSKTKSTIGDLIDSEGVLINDDEKKCEILNNFFASVFTHENTANIPNFIDRIYQEPLKDLEFTVEQVSKKLQSLNPSKAPGIDSIHPRVLKECHAELSRVLVTLFNKSINDSILPDPWKLAQVTPLFKKGEKKQSSNYRPVSLTVVLCKVLESLIRDSLMNHMDTNNLFNISQHGFRSQRSCVTQLLEIMEEWSEILDKGGKVDCIYLDFAKAFDTVPHQRLLIKLKAYGIQGQVLDWIENFLSDRKQQVRIGSSVSSWKDVLSGIPQGSVLGPILFLIYINDLPSAVNNITKLFADDTKLYREVVSRSDEENLQSDLDSLAEWSNKWQLRFNASKCKCIHYGKNCSNYVYTMCGQDIENVCTEKDLGVTFDQELRFSVHIQQKVKKANQILGMIRNTFQCLDKEVFLPLYKSLIRPHLEYASVIWKPNLKKDIISIENVQRRATKMVSGLKEFSYEERLKTLGLPTLYYRRDRSDMIQLFKIMHKYDVINTSNIDVAESGITRGHSLKLNKSRVLTRYGTQRFSTRVVNPWNSLKEEAVTAQSVNSFKSALNEAWKGRDSKFSVNHI